MLHQLNTAWRARRVLIIGRADRVSLFAQAFLAELGARPARIAPGQDAETLCRALSEGRISAILVPCLRQLAPEDDLLAQLRALLTLLGEAREAGVPLTLLCSDAGVYRAGGGSALEEDPLGGETRDGLIQSLVQLCADGVSRGLLGDAVSVQCVRHLPLLGCGHPATAPYTAWCRALMDNRLIPVEHPGMLGAFLHPLDMCCGAALLGARFLAGDTRCTGAFNLGAGAQSLMANRTAALRFIRDNGGTRPIRETEPPLAPALPMLCGARARLLCGAQPILPGGEALNLLLALERAARSGQSAELAEIERQTKLYLARLSQEP